MKAKIKKIIKEKRREDVYDLTVKDNHNFFANNILLHNSEQWLDAHNVCLLSSVNLAKYREYGPEKYPRMVNLMVHLLDAFRRYEVEERRSPSDLQMEKLVKLPRIGLGVTGLADYFIDKKIAYASPEAMDDIHHVFGTLAGESYKASYEIAKSDGFSFEYYDKEKYKQSPFVQNLLNKGLIEDYHLDYQAHVCKTTVAPNGCIVSSTKVKTENGTFSIKDLFAQQGINIDDDFDPGTILDLKTPINVETTEGLRKVNKLYVNGQTETIKVSTKDGREIEGTFNHKVLVKLDDKRAVWKPLEDLSEDDIILIKK